MGRSFIRRLSLAWALFFLLPNGQHLARGDFNFYETYFEHGPTPPQEIPQCLDRDQALPIDNNRIVQLKRTTENGKKFRGHLEGLVSRFFKQRASHVHFEVVMNYFASDSKGQTSLEQDVIEVIYNRAFGELPSMQPGMHVVACGEYITSNAQNGRYPPSPSAAIIHWVHQNPRNEGPHHGFLVIDGKLYGFDYDPAQDPTKGDIRADNEAALGTL